MLRGALYGLTAASIWGGMYVVSDVVLETIPPFVLLTLRLILGALALAVVLWRQPGLQRPARSEALPLLAIGLVGFGVSLGAQFVGTEKSTAVNGALITSASPAFILLFAALLLGERLTLRRIAALALATTGVVVIIDPTQIDFGAATFVGDLALAVAALSWGLYSVLTRKAAALEGGLDTLTVTFVALLGGLFVALPGAALELRQSHVGEIDLGIALGVLYLGVVSTAVAAWLWNRSFALVDAGTASLFFFAQPLVGALLSVWLLNQPFTVNLWLGALFIAAGVVLALYPVERLAGLRYRIQPVRAAPEG